LRGFSLFHPRLTLPLHIILRLDTFPYLAVQTAQMRALIVRFRYQHHMTTAHFNEQMIATLDVQFVAHRSGNKDLMLAIDSHTECHGEPPNTPGQSVSDGQLARAVLQCLRD
jgi:hypothetical protein